MNERQLRMLRWMSAMLEHLAKPELRHLLSEPDLQAVLIRGKMLVDAEIAMETTNEVEQIGVDKDLEELEKLYSLS